MDCMDCHDRPAHTFRSPDEAVDTALLTGAIKTDLPYVKKIAVEALAAEYPDRKVAHESIANTIVEFYRREHADVWSTRETDVKAAVAATQEIYGKNFFPEMKARWDVYPENVGHFRYIGCMRCHEGKHVSPDGVTLTNSCTACHVILAQGSGDRRELASTEEGLAFVHPEDIGDMWQETLCSDCHQGVQP